MNQIQNEGETTLTSATETSEGTHVTDATIVSDTTQNTPVVSKKSHIKYVLLGMVVALALGGGYTLYNRTEGDTAAMVNGTRITQTELSENISMMTKSAEMQGVDTTDATVTSEIRTQALENLINNALLIGAAKAAGMGANEAAVQSAYETLIGEVGGEEELKTRMETVGLTTETLFKNIGDRLMVDAYIESVTDIKSITVTDEEITTYLESVKTEGVTLPPLEEIKPQIEATLLAEKQQGVVNELIQKLRSEGKITITGAK